MMSSFSAWKTWVNAAIAPNFNFRYWIAMWDFVNFKSYLYLFKEFFWRHNAVILVTTLSGYHTGKCGYDFIHTGKYRSEKARISALFTQWLGRNNGLKLEWLHNFKVYFQRLIVTELLASEMIEKSYQNYFFLKLFSFLLFLFAGSELQFFTGFAVIFRKVLEQLFLRANTNMSL